jgi:phosphoribosylamine--glycine ligase
MRILVVGSGGREHALCWVLANKHHKLWCAPGNPGTAEIATNIPIKATDVESLVKFATVNDIDLVLPGSEVSLCYGIANGLASAGVPCFGPTREAAQLESSKEFTKQLCSAHNIPTAQWSAFNDANAAEEHVKRVDLPLYIKADGLAAGKGAMLAETESDAIAIIHDMMQRRTLGNAGSVVVIEEVLTGAELSFFALCNGKKAVPFGFARDYKRLNSDHRSPNTGGMGAYTLSQDRLQETVMERIVLPTLHAMTQREQPYTGILYAGLMLTGSGPKLIEYNVRFGDPECQAMMMCFQDDLYEVCDAVLRGDMPTLQNSGTTGITVVMAAPGYPQEPLKGSEIRSIEVPEGIVVFQAGTARTPGGRLIAAGGHVLNVCTTGDDLASARERVYAAIGQIDWPEGYYRHDIGA